MDDVSVYSLIASKLGPIATEFTESESSTLASDVAASLGANAGIAKADVTSRLQATDTRGSQVLRKSIVQTTFKELYELEESLLLLRPKPADMPPNVGSPRITLKSLLDVGAPWIVSAEEISRGMLVELEVELEVEPIFRNSLIVSTMLEMVQESPDLASAIEESSLSQFESAGRLLERLLAGLVPIRGRVLEYVVTEVEGQEILVHRTMWERLAEGETTRTAWDLVLVGVAEERLFWKDIRRVLFSRSPYRIFGRIARDGLHESWTLVKLEHLFRDVVPDFGAGVEMFNQSEFDVSRPDLDTNERAVIAALKSYAAGMAAIAGRDLPKGFDVEATVDRDLLGQPLRLSNRRTLFGSVAAAVEEILGQSIDPRASAHLRNLAIQAAGFDLSGKLAAAEASTAPPINKDERFLDAEFVAIYW